MPSLNTKLASAPNTTANYVLKATTSTTIGNSLIFDNGTQVGINTASPSYVLDVQANNATFVNRIINLNTSTDSAGLLVQAGVNAGNEIAIFKNAAGTSRMGIYANGNVGIGTTTPNVLLEIKGGSAMTSLSNSYTNAGLIHQYNSTNILALGSNGSQMIIQGVNAGTNGAVPLLIQPFGGNIGIATNSTPASLGSNYTTIEIKGQSGLYGGAIQFTSADGTNKGRIYIANDTYWIGTVNSLPLGFLTADNERMRITSSGFVGIGTNNPSRPFMVESANGGTTRIHNTRNLSGDVISTWELGGSNTNNTSSFYLYCDTDNVGVRMVIYGNGNLANVNGSYGTYSSDIRLKENIIPATSKLNDLMSLNVVNYNFKNDEEKKKQIGFIAQEFKEVFPSLVYERDTRKYDEQGNVIDGLEDALGLGVGMEFAIIVKAMQEQQAQIQELNTKIQDQQQTINSLINR
jgi:hypothetical protein